MIYKAGTVPANHGFALQVGSWLGAIPIPLDWDRDWQAWPITIVTGSYLGWLAFRLAGAYLLHGKRINFDE